MLEKSRPMRYPCRIGALALIALIGLSGSTKAAGNPEGVTWDDLVGGADAICEAWVVGVQELGEHFGTGKLFAPVPMRSTLERKWSLKGACPDRFVLSWDFHEERVLGEYGRDVFLFLKRVGSGESGAWELVRGALGVWGVENRRFDALSNEQLAYIAPDAIDQIVGVPPELFTEQQLEFRFGEQHRLFLRTRVVLSNDLVRWFKEHGSGAEKPAKSQ